MKRGILELADVQDRPRLFSTFLMWLLAELYQLSGPEAYDKAIDKKKFRQFLKNPPEDWTEE